MALATPMSRYSRRPPSPRRTTNAQNPYTNTINGPLPLRNVHAAVAHASPTCKSPCLHQWRNQQLPTWAGDRTGKMLRRLSTSPSRRLLSSLSPTYPIINPTPYTFVRILAAAAKSSYPSSGPQYHSAIFKLRFDSNVFINTALIDLYCKTHHFSSAHQLFDEMPERNVVTWNTIIHGYSQSHLPVLAVETFIQMVAAGFSPTPSGVSSALVACSLPDDSGIGTMLHCVSVNHGFMANVVVGTALVNLYSKCADVDDARRIFDEMQEKNVITWTSLVTGYALDQRATDAMLLVSEMRRQSVELNHMTYNSLLSCFSVFDDLLHGKQVHCLVIREGLESDPYIMVTLVTMYSKCGSSDDFVKLCPAVSTQDQIACNSVIAGFSHLGDGGRVLDRFSAMRRENIDTDIFTFASVLRAIGILSAIEEGRQTHALIFKTGYAFNVSIQNGLISMYAKCGVINDSKQVFSSMDKLDLFSWNAILSGCAQHGYGREALDLFEQMREIGVRPNDTTFLSLLTACSHVRLVQKGLEFFFYMMKQFDPPIVAGVEHYACVVDLLGRAGFLGEAETFVNNMPIKPGVSVYRALLSACQVHGNVVIAKRVADCLFELCPDDPSSHVLLSNVFKADGLWDNATGVREIMKWKGVRKKMARSWIDG